MDQYTSGIDIYRSPYSFSQDTTTDYTNDYTNDYSLSYGDSAKPSVENKDILKDPLEEKPIEAEDLPTWSEFTENTTFHGIKYVFQRGFKFRR